MNNAIEIRNLYKTYPGFSLNNISFTVPEGICCGFVGPNGAGKTTTLRTLTGMAAPDSGQIRLLDQPVSSYSVREEMGILFDQPYFQEEWTPRDIERGLRPFYKSWDSGRYRSLLARFELEDKQGKLGNELSKGMMQKVSICCALAIQPKVILLDEPMVGLDPAAIKELKEVVLELKSQGTTILISTHMLEMVKELWDVMFIMERGKIIGTFTREQTKDTDIEELFFQITGGGQQP